MRLVVYTIKTNMSIKSTALCCCCWVVLMAPYETTANLHTGIKYIDSFYFIFYIKSLRGTRWCAQANDDENHVKKLFSSICATLYEDVIMQIKFFVENTFFVKSECHWVWKQTKIKPTHNQLALSPLFGTMLLTNSVMSQFVACTQIFVLNVILFCNIILYRNYYTHIILFINNVIKHKLGCQMGALWYKGFVFSSRFSWVIIVFARNFPK